MFDSNEFHMIIDEILQNLIRVGDTPSLKQVLPKQNIPEDKLDLIIRYMSEEALIYIVAMGRSYSDPTIRLNIRPKGIKYIEGQFEGNSQNNIEKSIKKDIFDLVNRTYNKKKDKIKYLENLESKQMTLVPGSNEEKIVESRIKQINQNIQRDYTKSANTRSWLAFGLSIVSLIVSVIKYIIPAID